MVASYSELYEEGEVDHINGPTHPPTLVQGYMQRVSIEVEVEANQKAKDARVFIVNLATPRGVVR